VRLTILVALLIVASLQYKAWFSDVGFRAARVLEAELAAQKARTAELKASNAVLEAEVLALNGGTEVFEARARLVLGMVRHGEVFVLVGDTPR
jgi:cell division protein FtsB